MNPVQKNLALAPADTLRSRLSDLVTDFYKSLVRSRDSLLLTREQVDSLNAADGRYRPRADSVWAGLAKYIAESGDRPDLKEITRLMDAAKVRAWAIQREEVPRMMAVLVPAQRVLAQIMLRALIDSKDHLPSSPHIF